MWSKQSKDQGSDGKILHRYKLNILKLVTNLQVMPVLTDKTILIVICIMNIVTFITS